VVISEDPQDAQSGLGQTREKALADIAPNWLRETLAF
jgi:hypothetical protein